MKDGELRAKLTAELRIVGAWAAERSAASTEPGSRADYDRLIRYARHYARRLAAARTRAKLDAVQVRVAMIQRLSQRMYTRDFRRDMN